MSPLRSDEIVSLAYIGRIPVRNLWLLMLYASDLTRISGIFEGLVDKDFIELPNLIARLLVTAVELRLRRNLTNGYQRRASALNRVRGRIDVLTTEAQQLLSKGQVFCRFETLTTDTIRNRFVRAALHLAERIVDDQVLAHRCRSLAGDLARMGISGSCPSRAEMACQQFGRNDSADELMVSLGRLLFDLALPTEVKGLTPLFTPKRDEIWVRRLFEKAVLGFARVELKAMGYSVRGSIPLKWQVSNDSAGLTTILPAMVTDIIIDSIESFRRLVIDTKFTAILTQGRFDSERLKSGYLYQMYAYLRSQEGREARWTKASGLLLHPSVDGIIAESAVIQGHRITFATVDLIDSPIAIRKQLLGVLRDCLESDAYD